MNILEHYIQEIHSEEHDFKIPTIPDKTFVRVILTSECYGIIEKTEQIWTEEEWTQIKADGYYWG